jgi:hypothetical protein
MRKRTLVATLGAAGALTLAGIGVAIADPTTTPSPSPSTAAPDEDTGAGIDVDSRRQAIEEALQGLVEDGTLTEEQVDRVADELDDSPGGGHWWGWGHHGHHGWDGSAADFDRGWEAAAQALGMTTQELEDALSEDGTSLADIAEQRGVPSQTVVDALVAAAEERIAARLAEGSLSQEQADELRAEVPDWVAAAIDKDWWSHWGDHHD